MAVRIEVEKSGTNVVLRGPEHPLLAARAPALGGRAKGRDWTFPVAKEEQVRKLARELWGTDGKDRATATVRLDLSLYGEGPLGRQGEAWLAGRLIARRRSFDGPAELGEGVKLVAGGFSAWSGSPGRPALGARYGTIVDISDVPTSAAAQAEKQYPFEAKVVAGGEATVGAWSRTVTEKHPGPVARAEAKLSGKEPAKPGKPSPKAAAAPAPAPAKKAAPAAAAKKAAPAPKASAKKAAKKATKKAAPAPARKAAKKSAKKVSKKVAARPAPKAAKKATKKAAPARRPAKKAAKKATKKRAPARPAKKASKKAAARRPAPKASRGKRGKKKAARRGRR